MYYIQRGEVLIVMLGAGEISGGLIMTKKIKISELPEFDAAEYLNAEGDISAYLTAILEENDPALLAVALGDIARARGMSQVAKDAGIAREALYKVVQYSQLYRERS